MNYSIGEFSRLTGLGIHTLRYYEHENLIIPERNSSNRRRYSDRDIAWIDFIKRLKDTGMPIKAVSYTHLDVYKRQGPAGAGWAVFRECGYTPYACYVTVSTSIRRFRY